MLNKLLSIAALVTSLALAGTGHAEVREGRVAPPAATHLRERGSPARWLLVEGRRLDASDPALLARIAKADPTLLILGDDGVSATFHTVLPQWMYLRRLRKAAPGELITELIVVDRRIDASAIAGR